MPLWFMTTTTTIAWRMTVQQGLWKENITVCACWGVMGYDGRCRENSVGSS
jgi:hypothetical protein